MSKKIPKVIKDTFYVEWSSPNNYNDLIIKKVKDWINKSYLIDSAEFALNIALFKNKSNVCQ